MASTTRFHGVTLIAALEVFVIVRVLPGHYNFGDASLGRTACSVFAVNYLLLVLYLRVIHPRFFSPLRKFPKPKVRRFFPPSGYPTHQLTSGPR